MITEEMMKKQFLKTEKIMKKSREELLSFQEMAINYYGFSYNDCDLDIVVDGIDYGMGMTWKQFDDAMKSANNDSFDNDEN